MSTDPILQEAEGVLRFEKGPLHYQTITDRMIALGWKPSGRTPPGYVVYARIYGDIKESPDSTTFKFLKGGVFCLGEFIEAATEEAIKAAKPRRGTSVAAQDTHAKEERKRVRAERETATRTCGTCTFLVFEGIKAASMEGGTCEKFMESDRLCVRVGDESCEHWRLRSAAKRESDRCESLELVQIVRAINHNVQAGRSYGSVNRDAKDKKDKVKK